MDRAPSVANLLQSGQRATAISNEWERAFLVMVRRARRLRFRSASLLYISTMLQFRALIHLAGNAGNWRLQAHWRPGLILFSPELPNRTQLADIAAQSGFHCTILDPAAGHFHVPYLNLHFFDTYVFSYDCFIRMEAASEQATQVYQQNWGQFNLPNAHTLSVNSPAEFQCVTLLTRTGSWMNGHPGRINISNVVGEADRYLMRNEARILGIALTDNNAA